MRLAGILFAHTKKGQIDLLYALKIYVVAAILDFEAFLMKEFFEKELSSVTFFEICI